MEQPLISIITITYNAAETLPATMRSVAGQSFRDLEHIIVDGASKDSTLAVASEYRTPDTRIISEPDRGLYDAMNKGLRLARGKYLLFLNAGDCFADAESLADMAALTHGGKTDIVYGDTMIVNSEGTVIGPRHLSVPDILTFRSFSKGMLVCHQAFMVRRDIAPEYDLCYRFSADYDWTVRCLMKSAPGNCHNVGRPVIHYLSDGLTDRNKLASIRERFHIMRRHYGMTTAIARHLSFIPRAIGRKISKNTK